MENNVVEQNKNKNLIIGVMACIIVLLIAALVYFMFIKKDKSEETIKPQDNRQTENKEDTFNYDSSSASGFATVKGYVTLEKEDDCEDECDPKDVTYYDVVHFHIIETNSENFKNYINSFYPEEYKGDRTFRLGCLVNGTIEYFNSTDEIEFKDYVLNENISRKILNSNINNPITLKLEKYKLTGGSGAPVCYSHITNIDILD